MLFSPKEKNIFLIEQKPYGPPVTHGHWVGNHCNWSTLLLFLKSKTDVLKGKKLNIIIMSNLF